MGGHIKLHVYQLGSNVKVILIPYLWRLLGWIRVFHSIWQRGAQLARYRCAPFRNMGPEVLGFVDDGPVSRRRRIGERREMSTRLHSTTNRLLHIGPRASIRRGVRRCVRVRRRSLAFTWCATARRLVAGGLSDDQLFVEKQVGAWISIFGLATKVSAGMNPLPLLRTSQGCPGLFL
jgi:hypothetical protein